MEPSYLCLEGEGFVSPIVTVPRKDGAVRLSLNLKRFNILVKCRHFKMHFLESAFFVDDWSCAHTGFSHFM